MCLSKVMETYDPPSELIVDGWKEFKGTASQPRFSVNSLGGKTDVPLDVWLKAEGAVPIKADDGNGYAPWFHVYSDDLQNNTRYRRVYVRRITCSGMQDAMKVVIAEQMYVPSNPNDWPPQAAAPAPVPLPPPTTPPSPQRLIDKIRGKKGGVQ